MAPRPYDVLVVWVATAMIRWAEGRGNQDARVSDMAKMLLRTLDDAGLAIVPKAATKEMIGAAYAGDPLSCDVDSEETKTVYTRIWEAMLRASAK